MFRASSTRLRWQAASVASGMVLVLLAVGFTPWPHAWNTQLQDWLLARTATEPLPGDFVLVALDEPSIQLDMLEPHEVEGSRALQLMKEGFPWSREVYAILARQLLQAGARLVIFDLLFPSPREGDAEFAAVLREHPERIVLASHFELVGTNPDNTTAYFYLPNTTLLEAAPDQIGFANFPKQEAIRFLLPYATMESLLGEKPEENSAIQPFLGTTTARLLGHPTRVDFAPRRFRYSRPGSVRVAPLYEIFFHKTWEKNFGGGTAFQDRVVLVGATAEGMKDYFQTPMGRMSGPEIQLHALAATLRGQWLGQAGAIAMLISVPLAAAAAFGLVLCHLLPRWFILGLVTGALVWMGVCAGTFVGASYFLPMAPPLLTWLVCGFAGLACDVSLERRERGRLRGTLERYVSKDVVAEIVENPDSFLQTLGGQRKEIVALFSDLKGFTADSEHLDPAEMVALLNEYFGEMVEVVFARQGTLDKFMGDALMATWGCIRQATPQEDACNAVRAALDMKARLAALNATRAARNAKPWSAGVGICQGPAVFGNIGSQQKMEPTVIGDTVNLASRVESLTRVYGCDILVDTRVAEHATPLCAFLLVDEVRVKGRRTPEKLFFPHDGSDPAWIAAFTAARSLYLAGEYGEARKAFARLTQGGPAPDLARCYQIRCEGFFRVLPRAGWDGVWDFLEK